MKRAGAKGDCSAARDESTADFKTDRPVTLLWRPQPVRILQGVKGGGGGDWSVGQMTTRGYHTDSMTRRIWRTVGGETARLRNLTAVHSLQALRERWLCARDGQMVQIQQPEVQHGESGAHGHDMEVQSGLRLANGDAPHGGVVDAPVPGVLQHCKCLMVLRTQGCREEEISRKEEGNAMWRGDSEKTVQVEVPPQ